MASKQLVFWYRRYHHSTIGMRICVISRFIYFNPRCSYHYLQSRPASNVSQSTTSGTRTQFLSPADADRPIPLPSHAEQTPAMVPLPPTGSTIPMSLPDGCLPPGFVPIGPPTPLSQTSNERPVISSTAGPYHHLTFYSGSTVTAPLSDGGSVKGDTPIAIPPPLDKFSRRDESDDSSSDANSLQTPPTCYRIPSTGGIPHRVSLSRRWATQERG